MFRLTKEESELLTSQFAMSKKGRGGRRTLPYAFTEHGVAMLSSVLNSDRAVQVNIAVVRAFVRLRGLIATHKVLARKVAQLEKKHDRHEAGITEFKEVFEALKGLIEAPTPPPRRRIGFPAAQQK